MDPHDQPASSSAPLARHAQPRREMTGPYRARGRPLVTVLSALDGLGRLLPMRRRALPADRPLRVLVANWGHLGDVVSVLPLLKFVERHPAVGELGVVIGSWSRNVLQTTDIRAHLHVIDHWALDRGPASRLDKMRRYYTASSAHVRELADKRYDLSIDTFSTFPVTHALTWRARIGQRMGFDSGGLGTWLTQAAAWKPQDLRVIDQQLQLLKPVFGDSVPPTLAAAYPGFRPIDLPPDLGVRGHGHVILHIGAGAASREWVDEKWVWLGRKLRQQGLELVTTGAPGLEAERAARIATQIGAINSAGRLSWAQLVSLVASAAAVVSVDTVMGHLAACFNVPTVVLTAGRQRLAYWRPNSPNALSLTFPTGCQPCYRTNGCAAMACIRSIEQEAVLSAVRKLLGD